MTTEHTPGPWNRAYGSRFWHSHDAGVTGPDGILVASAIDFNEYARDEEVEANARLIAAAPEAPHDCGNPDCPGQINKRKLDVYPELLEALRNLVHSYDTGMGKKAVALRFELASEALVKVLRRPTKG